MKLVGTNVTELTRRNLLALLSLLDAGEDATLYQQTHDADGELVRVIVRAVEDIEHYRDREPGPVPELVKL